MSFLGKIKIVMLKGEKGDQGEAGSSGDYAGLTNKPSINSVELNGNKTLADLGLISQAMVEAMILSSHPIGSILMSAVNTNPSTYLGGTWVAWGSGRVPVGVDTSQTEFDTVEETGGEKTHTLTVSEMPDHNHPFSEDLEYLGFTNDTRIVQGGDTYLDVLRSNGHFGTATWGAGGDQPHNNLQPYITCYMWKRTA